MIENIDFEKSVNLVEIGAGTGAITSEILNRMRPDSRLFGYFTAPRSSGNYILHK